MWAQFTVLLFGAVVASRIYYISCEKVGQTWRNKSRVFVFGILDFWCKSRSLSLSQKILFPLYFSHPLFDWQTARKTGCFFPSQDKKSKRNSSQLSPFQRKLLFRTILNFCISIDIKNHANSDQREQQPQQRPSLSSSTSITTRAFEPNEVRYFKHKMGSQFKYS